MTRQSFEIRRDTIIEVVLDGINHPNPRQFAQSLGPSFLGGFTGYDPAAKQSTVDVAGVGVFYQSKDNPKHFVCDGDGGTITVIYRLQKERTRVVTPWLHRRTTGDSP